MVHTTGTEGVSDLSMDAAADGPDGTDTIDTTAGGIPPEAIDAARLAGLTLAIGTRFYTMGPQPCAVEYSDVPGYKRGCVETGTEVSVLGAKAHRFRGSTYVAVRIDSLFEAGHGWINICRDRTPFVVPITEPRPDNPRYRRRSNPY